jgi:hypothetical protein
VQNILNIRAISRPKISDILKEGFMGQTMAEKIFSAKVGREIYAKDGYV